MTVCVTTRATADERIFIVPKTSSDGRAVWIDIRVGESEDNFRAEFTVFCHTVDHMAEVMQSIQDQIVDAQAEAA